MSIDATETRIKFEVSFPGDDGHVSHRVAEVIKAMTGLGIRLVARLDGGTVYLLHDNEDAVESSTVDAGFAALDAAVELAVAASTECGMVVCGHDRKDHTDKPSAKAGAADPPGTHCRVPVNGHACRCPGFTAITYKGQS